MTHNLEKNRLAEIKAWRARFDVHPDLVDVAREPAMGEEPDSKVPVFQHTLEDYGFLLARMARLEVALQDLYDWGYGEGAPIAAHVAWDRAWAALHGSDEWAAEAMPDRDPEETGSR